MITFFLEIYHIINTAKIMNPNYNDKGLNTQFSKISHFFKALSHPIRLRLLDLLSKGPICVCELVPHFKISQAALSKHLKILIETDILGFNQEGKKNMYFIKQPQIAKLFEDVIKFIPKE